jgi:hypothetical protein
MTKHRVSELEGALLDAAVALALGYKHLGAVGVNYRNTDGKPFCLSGCNDWWQDEGGHFLCSGCHGFPDGYSENWSDGGPIIERERITVQPMDFMRRTDWQASTDRFLRTLQDGPTPLIAAMRAYVASKLGEEVELP